MKHHLTRPTLCQCFVHHLLHNHLCNHQDHTQAFTVLHHKPLSSLAGRACGGSTIPPTSLHGAMLTQNQHHPRGRDDGTTLPSATSCNITANNLNHRRPIDPSVLNHGHAASEIGMPTATSSGRSIQAHSNQFEPPGFAVVHSTAYTMFKRARFVLTETSRNLVSSIETADSVSVQPWQCDSPLSSTSP